MVATPVAVSRLAEEHLATVRAYLLERIGPDEIRAARRRLQRKALVVVAGFVTSYALVIFASDALWAVGLGMLGLMLAAYTSITVVMHDANHDAMFEGRIMNRIAGFWVDVFGGSSMLWRFKHNRVHHEQANVEQVDTDIQQEPFLRLNQFQKWHWWHRFQHLYAPVLYGFINIQIFAADFINLARRRVKNQLMQHKPALVEQLFFALGKVIFAVWAFALPVSVFGWRAVPVALAMMWVVGAALALTVQVAHSVDVVEQFEEPFEGSVGDFVRHQVSATADVESRGMTGAIVRWMTGGLDKQVAHHLAPDMPHTIYPALIPHIKALCEQYGTTYRSHPSVRSALASHFRWLRELGRRPAMV